VATDGLGSIGHFYPYGQEKPSATQNGTEKFATYFRDSETGLDYAKNRYHDPGTGRFMTPDPFWGSVKLTVPGTWNRYAYSLSDPINNSDPTGLTCAVLGQRWVDNGSGPGCQSVGTEVSDFGSVNQSSSGLTSVTSTFEPVACTEPCNDTPLDPLGQTVVNGVGTLLNTVSVGAFTYGQTAGTQIGPVEVGTDLVGQYDSSSGVSGGILGETALGPITVAVENTLSSSGESDGSLLGLLNFLPGTGFQLGIIVSGTNGTLGFYGGTDQAGGGIYFSLGGGVSPSYGTGGGYSGGTGVSDGPQEDEN
jgi:RHS repeat-associated protein